MECVRLACGSHCHVSVRLACGCGSHCHVSVRLACGCGSHCHVSVRLACGCGSHCHGPHGEPGERGVAEGRGEGHVHRVAAPGHQHAADARLVVAGVQCVPGIAQVDLEPRREVHRA